MNPSSTWDSLIREENEQVTLRNTRALCLIAMSLVPACTVLDIFAYPHLWGHFFVVRALAAFLEMVLLTISYTAFGRSHYRVLMLIVPMVPVVSIAWMIYCTGDPASPYYAGLGACLVGVGFLFQWSAIESLVAVALTIGLYLVATVPLLWGDNVDTDTFGTFVNNGLFLLLNSIIIVTGSVVHHRIRRNELISRLKLSDSRKELESKNAQLVEMDRLKTDFFSNITHELRTPLTLMLAPLQSLMRRFSAAADPASSRYGREVGGIYQNALRLLKLINDLLELASLDSGRLKVKRSRISISRFVEHISDSVSKLAGRGGVVMKRRTDFPADDVEADEEKIEKILLNLLFNAVKFTPRGGSVTLVTRAEGAHVVFEVIDTGIGIAAQSLPYIFDRFWQGDSSVTKEHPGTGIGLSLVKELVTQMGGTVDAASEVGTGTIMTVRLPLVIREGMAMIGDFADIEAEVVKPAAEELLREADAASASPAAETNQEHDSTSADWIKSVYREAELTQAQYRGDSDEAGITAQDDAVPSGDRASLPLVLIVDDEEGMLKFMHSELEEKFRIVEAGDGEEALEKIQSHKPDLIIADYMMPKLDGLRLCQVVRQNTESRLLPVMLVTARSDEQVRLNALRNGANDVLVKPFSLTEFHTRVHNLVQNGLLQREVEARNEDLEKTLGQLRSAERELIQSEKMAALGILTGGIMHEINNPLNFTRSALYVLDRRASRLPGESGKSIADVVADLREGLNRISTIVSDLRIFCHPDAALRGACPASEPVQSAARLLIGPFKESGAQLTEDIPGDLVLRGDRNQLTLVFLNLMKNAIDAMQARHVADELPRINVSARLDGDSYVVMRVTDNGPGIPPDDLRKVFDPFFTTKAPGEGTGLGLSLCYRIVTAHGGTISVDSNPGDGASFTLRLPLGDPAKISEVKVEPVLTA